MEPTLEHFAWGVCGLLAYLLVHTTLVVLEARARLATSRHDLVVKAKRMRAEYWASVAARGAQAEEDGEVVGVDVIEDEQDEGATEPAGRVGPETAAAEAEALKPAA